MHGGDDTLNADSSVNLPIISIIVPFRGSEWCVIECLQSLFAMDYPQERLEVIAVDDHCDDEIAQEIGRLFPGVRLLRNTNSLGCDGSKQMALDIAIGEFLALTDADCTVEAKWAQVIAGNLSGTADAVTGPVRHPKTFLMEMIGICDFQDFQDVRCAWSSAFPGCNVAMRRETGTSVRYQSGTGMRFGSDRLSSWKMYNNGIRILYDPAMAVQHFPSVTADSLIERRLRYGRKALALRKIDGTLPGSAITRLGALAIPAYITYKFAKDVWCTLKMACTGTVNPWHTPLLIPALLICRLVDSFGIASTLKPPTVTASSQTEAGASPRR